MYGEYPNLQYVVAKSGFSKYRLKIPIQTCPFLGAWRKKKLNWSTKNGSPAPRIFLASFYSGQEFTFKAPATANQYHAGHTTVHISHTMHHTGHIIHISKNHTIHHTKHTIHISKIRHYTIQDIHCQSR